MTEILSKELSRTAFLKRGGALIVGFSLAGAGLAGRASQAANAPNIPPDLTQVDSWLSINADNTVTMFPGKHEFGQGTWTGYRQIVAEELDVAVTAITIPQFDTASPHPFPDLGSTAASNGTAIGGPQLRQAAAEARRTLLGLASTQLGVAGLGAVGRQRRRLGRRQVGDLRLVAGRQALQHDHRRSRERTSAPLKPTSQYKVVGTRVPRFDIPDKVTGKHTYMQNVRIPGMWHGRPVRPRGQGDVLAATADGRAANYKLLSVDESSIKHIAGARVVRRGDFVGVVAPTEYAAVQAAAQLKVQWQEPAALPGVGNLYSAMRSAKTIGDTVILNYGNTDSALKSAAKVVSGTYEWPFQMHSPLGPCCAIADVRDGAATLIAQQQNGWGYRSSVAEVTGVPVNNIRVLIFEGASTFNPSPNTTTIVDAALMSQLLGKPVRVQYMRWDMHGWEPYGPPNLADIRGGLDANGKLIAFEHTSWLHGGLSAIPGTVQTATALPADSTSTRGRCAAREPAHADDDQRGRGRRDEVRDVHRGRPVLPEHPEPPLGREDDPEHVLDLGAPRAGRDPARVGGRDDDGRARLRGEHGCARVPAGAHDPRRLAARARQVAAVANWKPRVSASQVSNERYVRGRGIAIGGENHANDDVYAGTVAEVEVDRKTGKIVVKHLYGVQESGVIVNPAWPRTSSAAC